MNEYETLISEHQALQEQMAADPATVSLDRVQDFIQRTRGAGARITDAEQREQLRAILRHWGVFLYTQTGEYPASQLAPYIAVGAILRPPEPWLARLVLVLVFLVLAVAMTYSWIQTKQLQMRAITTILTATAASEMARSSMETSVAIEVAFSRQTASAVQYQSAAATKQAVAALATAQAAMTTAAIPTATITPTATLRWTATQSPTPATTPTFTTTPQPPVSSSMIQPDNADKLEVSATLRGHQQSVVLALAFRPDGSLLASVGTDGFVALWVIPDLTLLYRTKVTEPAGWTRAVAFSPDGQILIAGGNDGMIWLYSANGQATARLSGPNGYVLSLAVGANPRILASGSGDNVARLYDVVAGSELTRLNYPGILTMVSISPDGRVLAAGGCSKPDVASGQCGEGLVSLWDVSARPPTENVLLAGQASVGAIAFSPDGQILVSGDESGWIVLWDTTSKKALRKLARIQQSGIYSLAFNPHGDVLASGGTDGSVIIWDARTGQPIVDPLVPAEANGSKWSPVPVAFDPTGRYLATGTSNGAVSIWGIP